MKFVTVSGLRPADDFVPGSGPGQAIPAKAGIQPAGEFAYRASSK